MTNVLAQANFIGEYAHNIDKKGRIIIPARFRDELSGKIVVAKGLDGCLNIYTQQQWAVLMEQLASLPNTKREARVYRRNILAKASECEIDSQGRILIPSVLVAEAKIEKECVIAGVGNLIEIWSKERWDAFMDEHSDDFEEVAEGLTEFLQ
ncbi:MULTISPECIES: division/cell wall cluster transcriptional repressor MraZ [Breznakia]|uniref:Transcriptional regulator MraZ n=1 Tax=Breznakia blatticola TaxID=1754012 RepID=A0A4R7ZES7_9FIRM|nr:MULTISPECIES: division/cell wall cluster transcriptional repressor MraZ [Breznakia]MDH6366968.1 MraZ protein [Breznakia sp. PH1-1]MDH6404146.1 MraZ protein [Breznakia sp. PF1-11]MDH6411855.1 MraZ protein [Breznakia sp. PFB1-11]MDH6414134.1 MraZ protein [Breznakia sp. PFB1-14]MDH6416509.1 MraZ protein [Breznakia sp. PFB1-4]